MLLFYNSTVHNERYFFRRAATKMRLNSFLYFDFRRLNGNIILPTGIENIKMFRWVISR